MTTEVMARLSIFVLVLLALAVLEALWPRRKRAMPRMTRWATNLTFVGLGAAVVRLLAFIGAAVGLPLVAVLAALLAAQNGWGLFHWTGWPLWLEGLLTLIILDFAIWLQHWAAHHYHWLWVVHRVHHADTEIDVTTALRFHPIEIGLSMVWKVVWVIALGAPALAVMVFEIILNALAMFNHSNLALPGWLDRGLRQVIVTPDMHRVHHSIHDEEHRANFGFNLSIWDRMLRTYVPQPRDGHDGMAIGLATYRTDAPSKLWWSLKLPFGK
jgi:sterol desaturase/sphingolipid hydroxylase (fatty acid hydroxylase superfamily)